MAAQYCPKCGAPNAPGAAFCQYCGTALPPPQSRPLPATGASPASPLPPSQGWPAGPPPYGGAPYAPPPAPRRRLVLWIVVGFVVFILVVFVLAALLVPSSPAPNVVVTAINFESPDNACGLDGATASGLNASTNQSVALVYQISGVNNSAGTGTVSCVITSIETTTPGFGVTGANTPLDIPANATLNLGFNLLTPPDPYTGVLTFVVT